MTTVTAVKRALEETADQLENGTRLGEVRIKSVVRLIAADAKAVTILANRLSDRGAAGNAASAANLSALAEQGVVLATLQQGGKLSPEGVRFAAALEWAIDQLTPPERQPVTVYGKPLDQLTDVELESATKANNRRGATYDANLASIYAAETQRRQEAAK